MAAADPGTDEQAKPITPSFIDTLLQDTWLLALAVRNTDGVTVDSTLYQHCLNMIEDTQIKLRAAGASDYIAEEIRFAQCVFLDETVMTQKDVDVSFWWRESPLQSRLLMHLRGGEMFYEHIKTLLREASPSQAVMACYHRMLKLGYQGIYHLGEGEESEERTALLKQLQERLPASGSKLNNPIIVRNHRPDIRFWRRSPWIMRLAGALLIVAASCAMSTHLHYLLGQWFTLS
ncbi:type VI secretion system protein TssL, short form [Dryocola sp. LX212]